jgi:hypothetical protein
MEAEVEKIGVLRNTVATFDESSSASDSGAVAAGAAARV